MSALDASAWVNGLPDGWPGFVLGMVIIGAGLVGFMLLLALGFTTLLVPQAFSTRPRGCDCCAVLADTAEELADVVRYVPARIAEDYAEAVDRARESVADCTAP